MTTEDDTFKALKRTPYEQLRKEIYSTPSSPGIHAVMQICKIVEDNNWSLEDYFEQKLEDDRETSKKIYKDVIEQYRNSK